MNSSTFANPQEEKNSASFSTEGSYKDFHTFELRHLEMTLISEYFTDRKGKLLDIGCGYGRTTVPLADAGYHVIGIDVVPRMIETAHREHPAIDFRLMDVTDLQYPDESFDYELFSFNGIDYIYPESRRRLALAQMCRVLRSGGICILTSHNSTTLYTRIRKNTPMMFWRTVRQGLFTGPYIDAPGRAGDLITFCRVPWRQRVDFNRAGFDVLEVIGKKGSGWFNVNFRESWPYYVLQKK